MKMTAIRFLHRAATVTKEFMKKRRKRKIICRIFIKLKVIKYTIKYNKMFQNTQRSVLGVE